MTLEKHTSRLRKNTGTAANALSLSDLILDAVDIFLRRVFRFFVSAAFLARVNPRVTIMNYRAQRFAPTKIKL